MYSDLKNYQPKEVEYVLSEQVKEIFPQFLDFTTVKNEGKSIKTLNDSLKFISKNFVATYPTDETAMRRLDDFEIRNIREEYCIMQENEVPKRKMNLEETLEAIKLMKKKAEDAYNSILSEVAKYAAEVKNGTREINLSSNGTFCIALAGFYAIYTYDTERKVFVLAKAFPVEDPTSLWSNEETNRKSMLEFFGIEFPETVMPEQEEESDKDDDLPFGSEEE